jgi:hypothetical protein
VNLLAFLPLAFLVESSLANPTLTMVRSIPFHSQDISLTRALRRLEEMLEKGSLIMALAQFTFPVLKTPANLHPFYS